MKKRARRIIRLDHAGPAPRGGSGFTLIEVLVVVAIIALLISILLPSLNQAREQARVVKCLANLKALGVAVTAYLGDHRDVFCWGPAWVPPGSPPNTVPADPSPHSNFFGGKRGMGLPERPGSVLDTWYKPGGVADFLPAERPLNRYVTRAKLGQQAGGMDVYACPGDLNPTNGGIGRRSLFTERRMPRSSFDVCGTSYHSNVMYYVYARQVEGLSPSNTAHRVPLYTLYKRIVKILMSKGAHRGVILHEDPSDCAMGGIFYDYPPTYKHPGWHGKLDRYGYLFLDGHASYLYAPARIIKDHRYDAAGRYVECPPGQAGCTHGDANLVFRHDFGER